MIRRQPLVDLLLDPAGPPIAALVAPPGYGKTTLLAQWAEAEPRPVAWLTVDTLDNDPSVLVADLVSALARVGVVDPGTFRRRVVAPERIIATVVPHLANVLHERETPAVIVLDDVHRITHQPTLDVVVSLLEHLPPGWRAALAARTEPQLPFGRFRAHRRLVEIGTHMLALDAVETAALAAAAGHRLTTDEAARLADHCEGWAAGIYMAMMNRAEARARDERFVQADGPIADYLRNEVHASLDVEDSRFLLETSVLDEVTTEAAEAVTGMPWAGPRLERLARGNLLVQPAGDHREAWRYHGLLRDYLLAELERSQPVRLREVHRRAATWYESTGEIEHAIRHAFAARDMDTAGRILAAGALPLLFRGQQATLERFFEAFAPQDLVRNGPLAALGAWLNFVSGRPDQGTLLADIAERASWEGIPPDGTSTFDSQRAMLRAAMVRRGPRDALQQAWYAAAREQAGSRWLSSAQMLVGCGYMMTGDETSAVAAFEASALPSAAALSPSISLAVLASLRIRHGDWHAAAELIARARTSLPDAQNEDLLPGVAVSAIEARIAAQRGDMELARAAIVRAGIIRPVLNYGMPWVSVHALLELARAHLAISDPAGAQVVVREAEQIVHRRPDLGPITAELADFRRTLEEATFTLAGTSTLTAAELRILQLLPTYLTFGEIADRLAISRNTVKTHAMAIYGKLWASSRSEAVERAVEIGLLEPYPGLARRRD